MMRTLRRILAIARKELLVLMGTRQSRFMVLIPPIIQIFIFAWAATNGSKKRGRGGDQ